MASSRRFLAAILSGVALAGLIQTMSLAQVSGDALVNAHSNAAQLNTVFSD